MSNDLFTSLTNAAKESASEWLGLGQEKAATTGQTAKNTVSGSAENSGGTNLDQQVQAAQQEQQKANMKLYVIGGGIAVVVLVLVVVLAMRGKK